MYILVDLENHKGDMANIVTDLVSKYKVPVQIVDSVCRDCHRTDGGDRDKTPSMIMGQLHEGTVKKEDPSDRAEEAANELLMAARGVGRRTASKQNAIVRALDRKPIMMDEEIMILTDGNGPSTSILKNWPAPSPDLVTSSGDVHPSVDDDSGQHNMEDLASLHPTILACLMQNTPSVFANDQRLSPDDYDDDEDTKLEMDHSMGDEDPMAQFNQQLGSPNRPANRLPSSKYSISSGKLRRGRIVYNARDIAILESFYAADPNACADPMQKRQLMEQLGVDSTRLKVWFQNRRRKDKLRGYDRVLMP